MKKLLIALLLLIAPVAHAAPALTVPQGGTGQTAFPSGYILFGSTTLRLGTSTNLFWNDAANRLLFSFGSSTAQTISTLFATNLSINGETFTDLTGAGLTLSAGALTLNATGDWTGTFDGQEGSFYLARANHTGTQLASTISDFSSTARGLLSASYPLSYNSGTGAFSWLGLATTSNPTAGNIFYSNGSNGLIPIATSSINVGSATALAANGANCSAGNAPLGVDASGAVESCFDVWTEAENTAAAYVPQSRQLTISSANGQITLSAGAQSLTADRTWSLTYTGLATTSQPTSAQLLVSNGTAGVYGVSTTTRTYSGPFVVTGTLGAQVGGTNSTVTYTGLATTSQPASSNLLVSNGGAGVYGVATTSLSGNSQIALSNPVNVLGSSASTLSIVADSIGDTQLAFNTGQNLTTLSSPTFAGLTLSSPLSIANGGTGSTTVQVSQLIYGGATAYQSVATTSVTCTGTVSCTSFTAIGASPITINGTGGGGSGTVSTSTNEIAGRLSYWTSNSGTPATLGQVATSSVTNGTGISFSGTPGALVGGTSLTITNSSPLSGLSTSFPLSFANPTLSWVGLATSTALANTQLVYGTGVNTIGSEAAFTYDPTTNTFTTDNGIFSSSLRLPNGTSVTTDANGELAFDTDAWTRGAVQAWDGTASTYLVGVLTSDAPSNGQVPTWNTGGTITWETPTGGGGSGSTAWATTTAAGKILQYPVDTSALILVGGSSTSTAEFVLDPTTSTLTAGLSGADDSTITFNPDNTQQATIGIDYSNNKNFTIAMSSTLGTSDALTITPSTLRLGSGSSTPWAKLSIIGGTNEQSPTFYFGTTSSLTAGHEPILWGHATTTGKLDYARVAIGTTSPWGNAGLRDQFTVDGRIYSTWRNLECDSPGSNMVANVTGTTDVASFCGDFALDLDADGAVALANGYPPGVFLRPGATNPTNGDGQALRSWTRVTSGTTSPVMEAWVRADKYSNATVTPLYIVGFTATDGGGDTGAVPTDGVYFAASSTPNWMAITRAGNIETLTNTGIATSVATSTVSKMRIEYDDTQATFLIENRVVARHVTNIPSATVAPYVGLGLLTSPAAVGTPGASPWLYVSLVRVWFDDPPTANPQSAPAQSPVATAPHAYPVGLAAIALALYLTRKRYG